MYGRKSVGRILSIIRMSVLCALFSVLFLLLTPVGLQSASARVYLCPEPLPHTKVLRSSPRYHLCDDGIWRRTPDTPPHSAFSTSYNDPHFHPNSGLASPLCYLRYSGAFHDHEPIVLLPGEPFSAEKTAVPDTSSAAVCCFTGDIMCFRGQQFEASTKHGFDFWPSYRLVAGIFNKADFVCGNLETLLSPSNPLTKDRKTDDDGTPLCNGPVELLNALRKAGYDMFVTANNHSCDYLAEGIVETKKNLNEYNFANTGTSYPDGQPGPIGNFCIFDVKGIRIAILSYTHLINRRDKMTPEELDTLVNCYDYGNIRRDITTAKAAGAEFVVVYCHWGIENTEEITNYEILDSVKIAEAGADLIIGSHPHCLQSGRFIETSDGRRVFCIYSMGNFCSSMERVFNNDTVILRLELERDPSGSINSALSYIPCRVMSHGSCSHVVVPIEPELNGGLSDKRLEETDERISLIMEKIENGTFARYSGQQAK
ncbi:MAG: CapA family protein [Lachnospiraceae bacterium]|nr:CapA family protein [Lachnospiraceae bacterium]